MAYIKILLTCFYTLLFGAIVVGVCSLLLVIIPGFAAVTANFSINNSVAYSYIATIWLCVIFLKQVPSFAANITGITIMSVYELSHSMTHAGAGGDTGLGKGPGSKKHDEQGHGGTDRPGSTRGGNRPR